MLEVPGKLEARWVKTPLSLVDPCAALSWALCSATLDEERDPDQLQILFKCSPECSPKCFKLGPISTYATEFYW